MKKIILLSFLACGLSYTVPLWPAKSDRNLAVTFKQIFKKNKRKRLPCVGEPKIPKIIHQIWIGPKKMPQKFKKLMQTWKQFHPDWEYKLWTNDDLSNITLLNQAAFDAATNWGMKADILRYEILYQYGGLYVDLDFECIKPFDSLHYTYDFYAGLTWPHEVNNALVGTMPGSPILEAAIEVIAQTVKQRKNSVAYDAMGILEATGPIFFSDIIARYYLQVDSQTKDNMIIFPMSYFYGFPPGKRLEYWNGWLSREDVLAYVNPDSMGIHFWATSWE